MKVAVFSTKNYEIPFLQAVSSTHELVFIKDCLNLKTVQLAQGCQAVCCFVTDELTAPILKQLQQLEVQFITLRSAGYDHLDLTATKSLGLSAARVPAYSPEAVAEFALALLLSLQRKITQAHDRIRSHNFSLEGQLGRNLHGRTVGIIGAGHIGSVFAKLIAGFGCRILIYDPKPNKLCQDLGAIYTQLETVFEESDIISLHCLLNDSTRHIINAETMATMQTGVILINTGRGALIDTSALIQALKTGQIGAVGLDVYEDEGPLFFRDHSDNIILDDQFIRLQAFPNVLITGHQAFLSEEALQNIAIITMDNLTAFEKKTELNRL